MTTFHVSENPYGKHVVMVRDGVISFVPEDEANRDYQRYLAWVAEGNTPSPYPQQ